MRTIRGSETSPELSLRRCEHAKEQEKIRETAIAFFQGIRRFSSVIATNFADLGANLRLEIPAIDQHPRKRSEQNKDFAGHRTKV